MKKQSNFLFLMVLAIATFGSVPAFAGPPHSTPGLDAPTVSGLAAAGYMGYQFFKTQQLGRKKDK